MIEYIAIAIGSALGGMARYTISSIIAVDYFNARPVYATFCVNVLGSFCIGVLSRLSLSCKAQYNIVLNELLIIGLCGGFTTFSAFSLQNFEMIKEQQWAAVMVNIITSVVLCIACIWLGQLTVTTYNK